MLSPTEALKPGVVTGADYLASSSFVLCVLLSEARAVYVSRWIYCRALAVAQWIVHMPPKRGIQVRFLTARPGQR